jgi:Galactose-3-O-sulfotransferase/Sulfotransferase family
MRLLERFPRFHSRRKQRLELEKIAARAVAAEQESLRQRDQVLAERDAYLRQRDEALGERNEILRQRDQVLAERDAYLRQRDEALGERNEFLRQRDNAIGECNEILRQRDNEIGLKNLLAERSARYVHRADVVMRPAAATCDHLLLFLHLAKTGGMTLADIFARNFAPEDFLQVDMAETDASGMGTWSHAAVERALSRLKLSEVAQLRAVWGHYGQGIQAHLPKPCAVVTLLREPVDRVISVYHYLNEMAWQSTETLEEYFFGRKHYLLAFDNCMTRVLSGRPALDPAARPLASTEDVPRIGEEDLEAAGNNLDGYLVVGTTEQFDETLLILGRDLRWSLSDLAYKRVNVTASRPAEPDISDALREKILAWNRYDTRLVERACAHLARRITAYSGDFARDLLLFRELNSQFQRGAPVQELRRVERDAIASSANQAG